MGNNFITAVSDKLRRIDYFSIGPVFLAWFFAAYLLTPLGVILGIRTSYLRWIIGQELWLYTPFVFMVIGLGFICFLVGYGLLGKVWRPNKSVAPTKDPLPESSAWRAIIFGGLVAVGIASKVFKVFSGTYFHLHKNLLFVNAPYAALVGIADVLAIVGLGIAWTEFLRLRREGRAQSTRIWRALAYGLFIIEFLYGFFSLSKTATLFPVFAVLAALHYFDKSSMMRVAACACALLFVVFPIQSHFLAPVNMVAYQNYWQGHRGEDNPIIPVVDYVGDGVFGRFDLSRTLVKIVDKLGATGEFWQGESLKNFFVSMGPPRILWHSKPVINTGHNEFGRQFGILAQDDYTTAVAPGFLGDFYLNFGLGGVVLGALAMGALLGAANGFFRARLVSAYWVSVYGALLPQLILAQEGWIGASMAGIVKLFIAFLVLAVLLRVVFARSQKPQAA